MTEFEPTLDDVLNDILLALESEEKPFSPAAVQKWTTRFPQFEREITEFFITEAELEIAADRASSAAFDEKFAERSQKVLDDILQKARSRAGSNEAPLESLQKAAAARNLKFPELARKAGMSLQLLMSLEQRLVKAASISQKAKRKLAAALETSIETLNAYFQKPPQMLAGANYKSPDQPEIGEQQDFAELVRKDLKLTEEQKRELLD